MKSTIWLPPTRTRGPRQLSRSPTRLRSTRPPTPSPPPMWPRTWRKTRRKRLDLMRSRQTLLDASAKYRSVRKPLRSRHFRQFCRSNKDSHRRDSNPKPAVYKTAALPIELRWRLTCTGRCYSAPEVRFLPLAADDVAPLSTAFELSASRGNRGCYSAGIGPRKRQRRLTPDHAASAKAQRQHRQHQQIQNGRTGQATENDDRHRTLDFASNLATAQCNR